MEDEKVQQELRAAEVALNQGRYDAAERLLNAAAHSGAEPRHIQDLGRRVRAARREHESRVGISVWIGFLVAAIGYLIICSRQPTGWGVPIWLVLSLLVVPGIAGLFIGRRHAGERSPSAAFYDGLKAGALAMAGYSAFNLLVLASNLQEGPSQMGEALIAALATVIALSTGAGLIAGIASVGASRIGSAGKGETV